MSEDVENRSPELTKVKPGQGEREVDKEERGEDEQYVTVDNLNIHDKAQDPHGGPDKSKKKNGSRVTAVCLGVTTTLCLLLLAGIIGVIIHFMVPVKDRNDLAKELKQIKTNHSNLTGEKVYKNVDEDPAAAMKKILCESHGFTFGDGLCYYISTVERNWTQSLQYCRDNQSDLMIIKSIEKQGFVMSLNKRMWLGLTGWERNWKWVDGTIMTTSEYWNNGEPNNSGGGEDCGEIYDGGWNDSPCSGNKHWICERMD